MSKEAVPLTGTHALESRRLPAPARLDAWAERTWTNGMQVDALRDLDVILVRTRNTLYKITLVSARSGEAIVQGGRFFPEPARAIVLGCSLGGSFLKLRGIYCGFSLELYAAGTRIVTSGVQAVEIADDPHAGAVQ